MMNHRISVVITDANLDYGDAKVQEDILDLIREFQVNLVELCYFEVIAWLFWKKHIGRNPRFDRGHHWADFWDIGQTLS